jgi:hypothetical protein
MPLSLQAAASPPGLARLALAAWTRSGIDPDASIRVLDLAGEDEPGGLRGGTGQLAAAFSPDGARLAAGGWDGAVRLWGRECWTRGGSGASSPRLLAHPPPVRALAWHPASHLLATVAGDRVLRVWDAATGAELRRWSGPANLFSVAWSPDGRWLATGDEGHDVRLWDAATGGEVRTLRGHTNEVAAPAWSPDGRRLASGGHDRSVRLWDPASGREIGTLRSHPNRVQAVAWSPDNLRLAAAGDDGMVVIYAATPGAAGERSDRLLAARAENLAPRRGHAPRAEALARLGRRDEAAAAFRAARGRRALRRALEPGAGEASSGGFPALARLVLDEWLALHPEDAAVAGLRDAWRRRTATPAAVPPG